MNNGINEKELNSMNKHIPGKNFELYLYVVKTNEKPILLPDIIF